MDASQPRQFVWSGDAVFRRGAGPAPASRRAFLLLLARDPATREAVRRALPLSFGLVTAEDGARLLGLAEAFAPDLIVLDAGLPGREALDLRERLRSRPDLLGVPVLFLLRAGDDPALAEGLRDEAVLPEPFGAQELRDAFERLLGGRP